MSTFAYKINQENVVNEDKNTLKSENIVTEENKPEEKPQESENKQNPEEKAKFIADKTAEYNDKFANPYTAASYGYIDDVIEPRNTRFRVIRAFQALQTKKQVNPLKKHSNIPL